MVVHNFRKKVEIKTPKKGEKLRFVEMAEMNSKVTLENKEKDKSEILLELKDVLSLDKLPRKLKHMIFQIYLENIWWLVCV